MLFGPLPGRLALGALVLAAGLAALPHPLAAEEPDSTARWKASAELAYTDVSGNRSLALLSSRLGVGRSGDAAEFGVQFGMRYGRSDGDLAAETYTVELSGRLRPRAWVSPFLYTKGERDLIKNLDLRVAAAVGADLNLLPAADQQVSVGIAVLQDYERRLLPTGSTEPETIERTRFNLRLVAQPTIRKGVTAEHRTQFEPVADNLGDYLLTSKTSIRVLLTRTLAFQTSYEYSYDSTPAPGVESRTDRALTTGLVVNF
jgi:hypothetical protein